MYNKILQNLKLYRKKYYYRKFRKMRDKSMNIAVRKLADWIDQIVLHNVMKNLTKTD